MLLKKTEEARREVKTYIEKENCCVPAKGNEQKGQQTHERVRKIAEA